MSPPDKRGVTLENKLDSKIVNLTHGLAPMVHAIEDYVRTGNMCSKSIMAEKLSSQLGMGFSSEKFRDAIKYLLQRSVLDPEKLDKGVIKANADKIMPTSTYNASLNPQDLVRDIIEIVGQNAFPKSYVLEKLALQYKLPQNEIEAPFETAISVLITSDKIVDKLYLDLDTIALAEPKKAESSHSAVGKINERFAKIGMKSPVPQVARKYGSS